ncbi:MAG TPA: N-acetylglucosamine-6-phosphate deacetylase [Acidobacteriaceae bacterium]|jgi:N-acetylglucosamine-6-phosphate deacetylase|nr:N-acetylglucosamine-6-phosphate deacetylase [Acidobacteriaceae bacterium]
MKTALITAGQLITADGILEYPRIVIQADGGIASIEAGEPNNEATTLTPAFFDIHVHGAAGHDAMEGSGEALGSIGRFLAGKGIAHFLATTVTASIERTLRALDGIADAIDAAKKNNAALAAQPVGIHLEGPFLSHAKRGVHPAAELQPPSVELFQRFQQAARGHIRLMTIAPETPGALDLIAHATQSGTRVSVGHSDATAEETRAAIRSGAASATHTFNAMRRMDHREPGIAGVVLDAESLYAELICDGIHVAPEFVRLWMRAKTEERAILVTDGISATGMPDATYLLGELEVTVKDGRCLLTSDLANGVQTLAGSVLTMDRAVANLRSFTGASLATAVRVASRNPAKMLGMDGLGEIAVGGPANFNLYSATGRLQQTILLGEAVVAP